MAPDHPAYPNSTPADCASTLTTNADHTISVVNVMPEIGVTEIIATAQAVAFPIEFGFAPNAGEEMRPLRAIASSGEISRVMLAGKAVLARHDRIPLLVFDEIDSGVGGATALAVGKKLASLAGERQVLCVTHLPQVAAFADTHFVIDRTGTTARMRRVDGAARVEELSRMLSGLPEGDHARLAAALEAANGIDASVVNMRFIKPLDDELVLRAAAEIEALPELIPCGEGHGEPRLVAHIADKITQPGMVETGGAHLMLFEFITAEYDQSGRLIFLQHDLNKLFTE